MRQTIPSLSNELTASTSVRPPPIEPVAIGIADARRIYGVSRSELYRWLGANKIYAVKCGARTLILVDSLRQHFSTLPTAKFGKSSRVSGVGDPEGATRSTTPAGEIG